MPDTTRQEVHDAEAFYIGVHGKWAVFTGLGLAAVGLLLLNAGFGEAFTGKPDVVVGLLCQGGLYAVLGSFLVWRGRSQLKASSRRRSSGKDYARAPWLDEQVWDPRQAVHSGWRLALQGWGATGCVLSLMIPGTFAALYNRVEIAPLLFVGFFDLVALTLLYGTVAQTVRCLRGRADGILRFDRFPFFLGERLDAKLILPGNWRSLTRLQIKLRFITEQLERRCGAPETHAEEFLKSYQEYADSVTVEKGSLGSSGEGFPVSFALPTGDYATRLDAPCRRYWELLVVTEGGQPCRLKFMLPIFAFSPSIPR